jgi:hypothetical protein
MNTNYAQMSKLFNDTKPILLPRRNGVLQRTIGICDTLRLLYEFHDGFCGGHFAG